MRKGKNRLGLPAKKSFARNRNERGRKKFWPSPNAGDSGCIREKSKGENKTRIAFFPHQKFKTTSMKKTTLALSALLAAAFFACKKNNDGTSQISLTPSAATVTVGQQVSVTLTADANASNWTVTPSAATKAYGLTTSKVNYFTFNQAGVYTVSVRARNISYDSTRQSLNDAWNKNGGASGSCTKGVDTASVAITVTGK